MKKLKKRSWFRKFWYLNREEKYKNHFLYIAKENDQKILTEQSIKRNNNKMRIRIEKMEDILTQEFKGKSGIMHLKLKEIEMKMEEKFKEMNTNHEKDINEINIKLNKIISNSNETNETNEKLVRLLSKIN